ncbi:HAD family hydrolase [Microscilla marina]|uniref:phosphoglycolate phosphatase n=1 Tax=Microscilla marina ATCC 23134 TaxID=313606 RepID=A1ZC43_MICM2|nr:HAD family hydrolase [Microscilla marina]EAY31845.1 HAD-superfamily hydrolase subfamily IA [Microscilla marina ATCC 23134]
MNIKAIIFDLDGTLVNSVRDYADTANDVLNSYDFPTHTLQDYQRFLGNGLVDFVQSILPACYEPGSRVFEKCLEQFRRTYTANCCNYTTLYTGIVDLLDELSSANVPLSLLTNKPHEMTLKVAQAYLDRWKFFHLMGYQGLFPQKPAPNAALHIAQSIGIAPDSIALVGDTPADMHTARNAGMYGVGVAWGFRSVEELQEAGASKIVTEPKQIIDLVTNACVVG